MPKTSLRSGRIAKPIQAPPDTFRRLLGFAAKKEALAVLLLVLLLWELLPQIGILPKSLVPPLSTCLSAFVRLLTVSRLLVHIGSSLGTLSLGLSLAAALGLSLGILAGWHPRVRRIIMPFAQFLASVPPTAWVPIAMIFLGVAASMRVFLVCVGAVFPIFLNTFQAIKDTDRRYVQSARVFGASEFNILLNVHIRQSIGPILMSIRTGVGLGLIMMTVAEMYGSDSGVGFLLIQSKAFFRIPEMVVCMMTLGFIGWGLNELIKFLESKAIPWKDVAHHD